MLDEVFRTEWPRLVATLVRDLRDLELAEDVAQEAFVEASERWPNDGVPDSPRAWLLTIARRRAIDRIRRSDNHRRKLEIIEASARSARSGSARTPLVDDQLALILGCCHPALALDAQVALTLRIVAGLSTEQIGRAFLVTESTMTRRLTRAKTKIRDANIPFRPPDKAMLDERLPAAAHVVYVVFTEGHSSTQPTELIRGDLCDEAVWLARLLVDLAPSEPLVHELAALLLLTDARRAARVDDAGDLVLLEDQDRRLWHRPSIDEGLAHLRTAHELGSVGLFGLQAAVQAVHVSAPTFGDTDWAAVVEIYDRMTTLTANPIVHLNRAAAVSWAEGPHAGLVALDEVVATHDIDNYHYLHSARGDMLRRLGHSSDAANAYREAMKYCTNDAERSFLVRRIEQASR